MAFKQPRKPPDFSVLKKTLAQSKNNLDNATYQTISQLIDKLMHLQTTDAAEKQEIRTIIASSSGGSSNGGGNKTASYLTVGDETADLANSIVLLAGAGISFDDSVPNKRTISVTGESAMGYWTPLTDGDLVETSLIFAGGECVMVFVPTP